MRAWPAHRGVSVISMSPSATDLPSPRRRGILLRILFFVGGCRIAAAAFAAATAVPSLQVDYPFPTADKPQSKLWYTAGTWWALLPRAVGPSLWERTPEGWREHPSVAATLRGVPGRADVWFDADGVTAVTVADRQLAVIRLTWSDGIASGWQAEVLARLHAPASDAFETATLARDGRGHWWAAAVVQGKVYAWDSPDGRAWSRALALGSGLHVDDLCLVTAVPGGVAAIWSNQRTDTVMTRLHRDGAPPAAWEPPVTIAQGGRTADDHLNAALAPDGTLWLATKNSVDEESEPQLILRIRSPDGRWRNLPYAPVTAGRAPSRPAVFATSIPGRVLLGHVVYDPDDSTRDHIVFGFADPSDPRVLPAPVTVIAPSPALASRVNDLTGPKAAFPADGPWIVLGSDEDGRVYETDLRTLLELGRSK